MYSLKRVRPHIWHIGIDCGYELAMTFLRAQESYESVNENFRGKFFRILDFMEWYSNESAYAGEVGERSFTYPTDFKGFNVPHYTLDALYPWNRLNTEIPDWNRYDERMYGFLKEIRLHEDENEFYVIGTSSSSPKGIFGHELAHGYYYTDEKYLREMNKVILDSKHEYATSQIRDALMEMGYFDAVLDDEIQAYCATGFSSYMVHLLEDERVMALVREVGHVFASWEKKYNG